MATEAEGTEERPKGKRWYRECTEEKWEAESGKEQSKQGVGGFECHDGNWGLLDIPGHTSPGEDRQLIWDSEI